MCLSSKDKSEIFKNYVGTLGLVLGGLFVAVQFFLFDMRQRKAEVELAEREAAKATAVNVALRADQVAPQDSQGCFIHGELDFVNVGTATVVLDQEELTVSVGRVVVVGGKTGFWEPVAKVRIVIPDGILGTLTLVSGRQIALPFVASVEAPGVYMVTYLQDLPGRPGKRQAAGPPVRLLASKLVTVKDGDGCAP